MLPSDGILLVAHTKPSYWREAATLATSIRRFSPHLPIALASDLNIPEKAWRKAGISNYVPYDFRGCQGLAFKLHLDAITPFSGSTAFIDSDCICYSDISSVFDTFSEHAFVTLGFPLTACHWFPDEESVRRETGIDEFPFFTGDFYVFRKSSITATIFAHAREFEKANDTLGIRRLGRSVNDEPLISLAMAKAGVRAAAHDGTWILQLQHQQCESVRLDYAGGLAEATFRSQPIKPRLIHFQAHRSTPLYYRERYRVHNPSSAPWSRATSICVGHAQSLAFRLSRRVKALVRRLSLLH